MPIFRHISGEHLVELTERELVLRRLQTAVTHWNIYKYYLFIHYKDVIRTVYDNVNYIRSL